MILEAFPEEVVQEVSPSKENRSEEKHGVQWNEVVRLQAKDTGPQPILDVGPGALPGLPGHGQGWGWWKGRAGRAGMVTSELVTWPVLLTFTL